MRRKIDKIVKSNIKGRIRVKKLTERELRWKRKFIPKTGEPSTSLNLIYAMKETINISNNTNFI